MNKVEETKIWEVYNDEIDRLFPKGDKRRGDALVLGAMIFKELSTLIQKEREEAVRGFWNWYMHQNYINYGEDVTKEYLTQTKGGRE